MMKKLVCLVLSVIMTVSTLFALPLNTIAQETNAAASQCKSHKYSTSTTKATVSKDGKTVKICSVCKKTITTVIPKASNITLSGTSYTYNGKTKKPSVTVKDSKGKVLKAGTDYDVSYASGRKNIGKYCVTVKLKGKYSGTKKLYFSIIPKGTSISKFVGVSNGFKVYWNKQTTQTTGYKIQYSTSSKFTNSKTVTVSSNTNYARLITKLSPSNKYYVRIRTYKTVGKTNYYSSWSTTKTVTTKAADYWNLLLVNPWNKIPTDYQSTIKRTQLRNGQSVDTRCYADLQKMMDDCRKAGHDPVICSSYRTQETQEYLYNRKVNQFKNKGYSTAEAKKRAGKIVAVPGTSEHQLGLAVDIVDSSYQVLDEKQEKTATQKWLMKNSYKYGWILRYPSSKSSITGIIYEPWHYRYVGKKAAKEIHDSGVCLEEYLKK